MITFVSIGEERIAEMVELFDAYRIFYRKESDKNGAKEFLLERMRKNESKIFAAEDEKTKKLLGYVQLYPLFSSVQMKKVWVLNDLFVLPEFRKNGVGEFLMEESKKFANTSDVARLLLCTEKNNFSAQKLYEKVGYTEDAMKYYVLPLNQ